MYLKLMFITLEKYVLSDLSLKRHELEKLYEALL